MDSDTFLKEIVDRIRRPIREDRDVEFEGNPAVNKTGVRHELSDVGYLLSAGDHISDLSADNLKTVDNEFGRFSATVRNHDYKGAGRKPSSGVTITWKLAEDKSGNEYCLAYVGFGIGAGPPDVWFLVQLEEYIV